MTEQNRSFTISNQQKLFFAPQMRQSVAKISTYRSLGLRFVANKAQVKARKAVQAAHNRGQPTLPNHCGATLITPEPRC